MFGNITSSGKNTSQGTLQKFYTVHVYAEGTAQFGIGYNISFLCNTPCTTKDQLRDALLNKNVACTGVRAHATYDASNFRTIIEFDVVQSVGVIYNNGNYYLRLKNSGIYSSIGGQAGSSEFNYTNIDIDINNISTIECFEM